MGKNDVPPGFADLIEQAQRSPVPNKRLAPGDLSSPFPMPLPADHRLVNNVDLPDKTPGVPQYDFEPHVEFFCIPKDARLYEEAMSRILNGKAVLRYEEKTFTKEGDFLIAICYLTYKPNPRRLAQERREEQEEREELVRKVQ